MQITVAVSASLESEAHTPSSASAFVEDVFILCQVLQSQEMVIGVITNLQFGSNQIDTAAELQHVQFSRALLLLDWLQFCLRFRPFPEHLVEVLFQLLVARGVSDERIGDKRVGLDSFPCLGRHSGKECCHAADKYSKRDFHCF